MMMWVKFGLLGGGLVECAVSPEKVYRRDDSPLDV